MSISVLKNSMALLYKRKSKDVIRQKDLEFMITMDFRWFSPKEASALIELALTSGILKKSKEGLEITFNWRDFDLPMGFKPTAEIFETASHRSCFVAIVDAIEKDTGSPRSKIVAGINKKQDSLNLAIEVAALLYGAANNVDVSIFYEMVEKELMSRFGNKTS